MTPGPALRCAGCGAEVAGEPYAFRCPNAGRDDADHVLVPVPAPLPADAPPLPDPREAQPFARWRAAFHSYAMARAGGMADAAYVALVHELDAAVAAVDGAGFRATPFAPSETLGRWLGFAAGEVWAKDETRHVAGSHKARHLFGLALALEVVERTGLTTRAASDARGLAIASCGNAALAAAVVARACGRPLRVFIPADANPRVVERLLALGAAVTVCEREPGRPGDPCVHAFHDAVAGGALPFCCQGNENGLAIEGGTTLALEMAEALHGRGVALDRLFVQVGGGALASACARGLEQAHAAGLLASLPRLHAVQTQGAWPLRRAYLALRDEVLGPGDSDEAVAVGHAAAVTQAVALDRECAERLCTRGEHARVAAALDGARRARSRYMRPWDTAPHSVAHGILDDETYDWFEVVRATVASGGWPVTVGEERLLLARDLAHTAGVRADATGAAGLAGLMELRAAGVIPGDERVAVLLTGIER